MYKFNCSNAEKEYYIRAQNVCSGIKFQGVIPNRDDNVAEVAIILGRYMQYRFRVWCNLCVDPGSVVDYTLREYRLRTKVSDTFFENVLLFLNRYWEYSRYLPISLNSVN